MAVLPDIAGYIAAQDRLRLDFGCSVTFHVPVAPTWPEGTKINPDTGLPYDSVLKPTNPPGYTTVTKTCLIILKQASPLRPQSDTAVTPIGEMSGMDIIIDIADEDYPEVADADEMIVNGLDYECREAKPFAIGGTMYRWLIYGEEK